MLVITSVQIMYMLHDYNLFVIVYADSYSLNIFHYTT